MSLLRRLDTHHKLYASFAMLLCLGMGMSLWMLGRLEHMSLLTALPGQKLSGATLQAHAGYENARLLALVALGVTLGAAVMLGLWLRAEVAAPLHAAAAMARRLSQGDLSSKIGLSAEGDAGQLLAAMQDMNDSLAGIIVRVRASAEGIAGSAGQAAASGAALACHAAEQQALLAQGAAAIEQIASGAGVEQAAAVEQLVQVLAALGQAAVSQSAQAAQAAGAAAAAREQAERLSRLSAAFVLGPEHDMAWPPIRLASSNRAPLAAAGPADMRHRHAPVRASVALAPAPQRSHGAAAHMEEF